MFQVPRGWGKLGRDWTPCLGTPDSETFLGLTDVTPDHPPVIPEEANSPNIGMVETTGEDGWGRNPLLIL